MIRRERSDLQRKISRLPKKSCTHTCRRVIYTKKLLRRVDGRQKFRGPIDDEDEIVDGLKNGHVRDAKASLKRPWREDKTNACPALVCLYLRLPGGLVNIVNMKGSSGARSSLNKYSYL